MVIKKSYPIYLPYVMYPQIEDKVQQVKVVQDRLNKTWENKKEYHDQLYDFHIFLRDAGQLENTCSSQEVYHWFKSWNVVFFHSK